MKTPSVLKNLLTNKIVLNVVTIIAFLNMIGYLITGKITPVLFFIVLGMLHYGLLRSARKACVSCYTKAKQAKSGKGFFMPKVFSVGRIIIK